LPAQPPSRQIVICLSDELFAPFIERPIDELHPVDEDILGVRAVGQARVVGQPKLVLDDDPGRATFRVTIEGTVQTQTVGRKGPVEIHSSSKTSFSATKRVTFQPGCGFVGEPAQIEAKTTSQTERIEPDRRGILGRAIERRAWRRVAESRAEAERIVQAKAEVRIREAFDRLLEARMARVNRRVDQRYVIGALLGGHQAPCYQCWTRGGSLVITASADRHSSESPAVDQLAFATQDPPVQVWVHEGVVGDRLAAVLRGVDLARRMLGHLAAAIPAADASAVRSRPSGAYDFSAVGDWIVVHAGNSGDSRVERTTAVNAPDFAGSAGTGGSAGGQ
jgi:hypothetical protein